MDPVIDPFRSLLLSIANDCSDDDFTNMKFLCEGCIPEGRVDAIATPQQLFTELMHECYLNSDKKHFLASLLFHIGRHDLRNRLLGKEGKMDCLSFRLLSLCAFHLFVSFISLLT